MTASRIAAALLFSLLAIAPAAFGETDAQGFIRIRPDEVKWGPPDALGVQTAVIDGDPSKPGIYVIRIKFPPHVMSHNHFHVEDRHALVIKGTWWTGTGNEFAPLQLLIEHVVQSCRFLYVAVNSIRNFLR